MSTTVRSTNRIRIGGLLGGIMMLGFIYTLAAMLK
jgi:hypothetical protein